MAETAISPTVDTGNTDTSKTAKIRFKDRLRIRMALYRIWFKKNLSTCITCGVIALAVVIICGFITPETPIIGPIFGALSQDFAVWFTGVPNASLEENLFTGLALATSLLTLIVVFFCRMKRLTGTDIDEKCEQKLAKLGYKIDTNYTQVKTILGKPVTDDEINSTEVQDSKVLVKSHGKHFLTNNPISQLIKAGKQFFRITFNKLPVEANVSNTEEVYVKMADTRVIDLTGTTEPVVPTAPVTPEPPKEQTPAPVPTPAPDTTPEPQTPECTLPPKQSLFSAIGAAISAWFNKLGAYMTERRYEKKRKRLAAMEEAVAFLKKDIEEYDRIKAEINAETGEYSDKPVQKQTTAVVGELDDFITLATTPAPQPTAVSAQGRLFFEDNDTLVQHTTATKTVVADTKPVETVRSEKSQVLSVKPAEEAAPVATEDKVAAKVTVVDLFEK